jgi:Dienelactone hydrolase family
MNKIVSIALCVAAMVGFTACNNGDSEKNGSANTEKKAVSPDWAEENITYTGDGTTMNGFVVYDKNDTSKKPAVLVVPEWWGMNGYAKMRAKELAKLGYVAMAIDVYGNGKTADTPTVLAPTPRPFTKIRPKPN